MENIESSSNRSNECRNIIKDFMLDLLYVIGIRREIGGRIYRRETEVSEKIHKGNKISYELKFYVQTSDNGLTNKIYVSLDEYNKLHIGDEYYVKCKGIFNRP